MAERPIVIGGGHLVDPSQGIDGPASLLIEAGRVSAVHRGGDDPGRPDGAVCIDARGRHVLPGLIDARVHVGEPGAEHRETIASASRAAAAGGVTGFVMMPDTDPVIDDAALVDYVRRLARDSAVVNVYPSVAVTKGFGGEALTELGLLKEAGAVMATEGRRTLRNNLTLRRALTYARDFGLVVAMETHDPDLSAGGVMNEGLTATHLGLPGIPREAEVIPLERDLRLAALTGSAYHAAKLSTAASAAALKSARAESAAVTAGVSINHLSLNEIDVGRYRTFFRLSPPLRAEEDRQAMVAAVADGTIDIIVSSHDPQDVDTKRLPFAEAADGAIGLETLLAAALRLYHGGELSLSRLVECLSKRPAEIFGLPGGTLRAGAAADLVVADLDLPWVVSEADIVSRSKNTPFEGARFSGRVLQTMVAGSIVHSLE
ncbi:MAG: dihydroorotase [Alphaproteobacteria bacterium]|nr:MAG: dihydroorotase [Alphaproteobacteria bacterium]